MPPDTNLKSQFAFAFSLIIKLTLVFLVFIGTGTIRPILIALILFVILPLDFFFEKQFHKRLWIVTCIVLLASICISFPFRNRIEPFRFSVLADIYHTAAHNIMLDVVTSDDTSWRQESVPCPFGLIVGNKVVVMKSDSHIALYFPTWNSTFNSYGMFYVSDQTARNWLESPEKFDQGLDTTAAYDWLIVLEKDWYYVKLY